MKQNRRSTPLGTKDLLLDESHIRRDIERKLSSLFVNRGFWEVMTPGIEFMDVFVGEHPAIPPESMYKMTDSKGRLLVMRPDSTMPIARLAATRLQNEPAPLRLYYAQDVYQMNVGLTGRADQEFQAGVELIGVGGKRADLEMIALAARALETVVKSGYRIEIGHVGFFESLMDELDADEAVEEEIRTLIEGKNYAALGDLLDTLPASDAVQALRRLPHLFGNEQVLVAAKSLCRTSRGEEALTYLASLYESLCAVGLGDRVIFDLGMLHSNEYYTGVIFRGYVQGSGDIALSGGRYDALLEEFGSKQPATGFALNVDALMRVLKQRGDIPEPVQCDVLVHAADGCEAQALSLVAQKNAEGIRCEYSVFNTLQEATQYATQKGMTELIVVDNATTVTRLREE